MTVDGYAASSLINLASSLWGTSGRLSGVAAASVARFESGNTTAYGELHGAFGLSSDARDLSAFKLDGGAGSYRGHSSSHYVQTSILLGRLSSNGLMAAWLDAGVGSVGDERSRGTAHATAGATGHFASVAVDATVGIAGVASITYADALIDARWAPFRNEPVDAARFVLGIGAGARSSNEIPGRQAWINGVATLRIHGPVSLVGYAGAQPSDPMRGTPGVTFTSVALRVELGRSGVPRPPPIASAARATSVSAEASGGRRVISVLAPEAKTLQLMGDFTAWLPVSMTRSAAGVWHASVTVGQGSHRVNIRSDSGAWIPAPGLPVAGDDFGGSVGILVVP